VEFERFSRSPSGDLLSDDFDECFGFDRVFQLHAVEDGRDLELVFGYTVPLQRTSQGFASLDGFEDQSVGLDVDFRCVGEVSEAAHRTREGSGIVGEIDRAREPVEDVDDIPFLDEVGHDADVVAFRDHIGDDLLRPQAVDREGVGALDCGIAVLDKFLGGLIR